MTIATIVNPRVNDPSVEPLVRAEVTNILFRYTSGIHLATLAVAVLVVLLFRDVIPERILYGWLAVVGVVEITRGVLAAVFRRRSIPVEDNPRWARIFAVGTIVSALEWSAAGIFLFASDSVIYQALLAMVIVGTCAVATPVLSPRFFLQVAFVGVAGVPVIVRLALDGSMIAGVAGLLAGLGLVMLVAIGLRVHRDLLDSLRSRFAYADLADELTSEVTERQRMEDTIRQSDKRARRQSQLLLELARETSISTGDLDTAIPAIAKKAARALRCSRVSVWNFDHDYRDFDCRHIFDEGAQNSAPGILLTRKGDDAFLRRLNRTRSFGIYDVRYDRRTEEFVEGYFRPFNIVSVVGAPFRQGDRVGGVILLEHTGYPRNWTRDERLFASSVADFISLAIASADRRDAEARLRHLANYDRLTGLPNRTLFHDRMGHALMKAQRSGKRVGVLFVDLDRFKAINDSLGHHTGDRVLRAMGKRLLRCVRQGDTVARIGGDEFTVILEELGSIEEITEVVERILETVAEPIIHEDTELTLTTSIGISLYPDDGEDVAAIMQNSDTAMYRAKEQGRNNYQFFTKDLHTKAMRRLAKESALRKALQRNEFLLHYQPQVDTRNGRIIGVEALVRWRNPDSGMIMPAEFIPLAEETGLIIPLGEWVLREACMQAKQWYDQLETPVHMAVNLSVGQFSMQRVPELVEEVLQETKLPPQTLLLEITETLAMTDAEGNLRLLNRLKDLDTRLALDDFGTGNSSLSYLKRFPVDVVKIDRTFVRDLTIDPHDAAIARAIIALSQSLELELVAEGVETEVQKRWLQENECPVMQGYLFSHPLTAEQCRKMLLPQFSTAKQN